MKQHDPIPAAPGALPLLGHALPLLSDPLSFLMSLPAHGDLVRIGIGTRQAIVVCDPGLTRQVLLDGRTFDKGGPFLDAAKEVGGNGLVTCLHDQHSRQRRLVQPAFHPMRLAGYSPAMTEQIISVTETWVKGQSIDVLSEMYKLSSRVLLGTMFGTALGPAETVRAVDDLTVILSGMYARMLMPAWVRQLPLPVNRRFHRANSRLRKTVAALVNEHRAHATGAEGNRGGDLVSMLLGARDTETDGQGLSDAELADQAVSFFIAGIDTTASLLSWTLHLLTVRPDIEHRLHAEVDTVLVGRPPAYEDIPRLQLTSRILNETLRLHPAVWLFTRTATVDTRLGEYSIPRGTTIVHSPYLIHHRPDLYRDAERFDPDRWEADTPRRDIFIPFGAGARKCIGDTFSLTEATLALANITSHWRFQPLTANPVCDFPRATLRPQRLWLQAIPRGSARN
ncbi:cytochrome P450 [Streptomyces sp. TRM72054]|uniref:cytochrome P450 n=1 Tax=Streptomyces sp. TRM72054 TaxID=2870562 RepID=UPI001C8B90D8|nr:cytochrome P450 [Streptomyces sp. TRM72054]MBX9399325.1 cytochrome P450 [Streptomyces sp. TRM72054]